ncbi:estradiol 17-beta-dehydrogenase 11 [Scaptodrosophila lebanonensis]|uniref:Short-chain dehydrogenase/reductase 3 n=1 Tax=Drosophila lebanonensis TaxID=7225 RepID=A0A6J2T674_DROLE|nr:estradiol 17-beta-dehydrogenase 11 [Scaptodrosophila lebanonensis]
MSFINSLVKVQAYLALVGLICIHPLLMFVALLTKIFAKCACRAPQNIEGEVALVTGAGHGLGRAIALELAKKGCHIAAVDINLSGAESTVKLISDTCAVRAKAYKVNVANYLELETANEQISADLGFVTILINNAGILMLRNPINPEPADIQRMMDVNVLSHFWTKGVFLPKMKELRRGHIVTISSAASLFPLAYNTAYVASKFAASGHMKALRQELLIERQPDIHVCTVMPSFLRTNDEVTDVANEVRFNRIYPLISGEAAARRIVKGMLRYEREIVLPDMLALIYRAIVVMPAYWQDHLGPWIFGDRFREFHKLKA